MIDRVCQIRFQFHQFCRFCHQFLGWMCCSGSSCRLSYPSPGLIQFFISSWLTIHRYFFLFFSSNCCPYLHYLMISSSFSWLSLNLIMVILNFRPQPNPAALITRSRNRSPARCSWRGWFRWWWWRGSWSLAAPSWPPHYPISFYWPHCQAWLGSKCRGSRDQ